MKKRLFSILLIPCIVIILMPIMAFAETRNCTYCGDNQLTVIYTNKDSLYHDVENYCTKCRVGTLIGQEAHNLEDRWNRGEKGHWKSCSVCYGQVNYEVHKWSEFKTDTPATCTKAGTESRKCEICNRGSYRTIQKVEHNWKSDYTIDKEATCESDGSKSIHCRYCDAVKDSETIKATGHKEVVLEGKSATVFSNGLTEGKKCSVCGVVLVAQEEIPELEVGTPAFTVKTAKKAMTVKASRAENATGYKIFYKKANAKLWKTWTEKGKKVSKKFAKLEKGKYKVKVRAYAKDYEGSGAVKWSNITKVKTVKIK